MKCRTFILTLLSLTSACVPGHPREAVGFFRVNVTVDDDGSERSGSSVWRLATRRSLFNFTGLTNFQFEAEAIPVRLHDGSWLFFLPQDETGNWGDIWIQDTLSDQGFTDSEDNVVNLLALSKRLGAHTEINCVPVDLHVRNHPGLPYCPIVLRSDNPSNSKSFKVVKLGRKSHHGSGVTIKSFSVTVVTKQPTNNLYALLPWLHRLDMKSPRDNPYIKLEVLEPRELQSIRYPPARQNY